MNRRSRSLGRRPLLHLDDVSLRVGQIGKGDRACPINVHRHHLAQASTAGFHNRIAGGHDILYREGDVSQPWTVDSRAGTRF